MWQAELSFKFISSISPLILKLSPGFVKLCSHRRVRVERFQCRYPG